MEAAEEELAKLQEGGGSAEDIERQQKRTVRASREQSEEVKRLLNALETRLFQIHLYTARTKAETRLHNTV